MSYSETVQFSATTNDSHHTGTQEKLTKEEKLKIQQCIMKMICPFCSKRYKQKYILNTHIKSVHKKNPHLCDECDESFPTIQEYKDHVCKNLHPELQDPKVKIENQNQQQQKVLEKCSLTQLGMQNKQQQDMEKLDQSLKIKRQNLLYHFQSQQQNDLQQLRNITNNQKKQEQESNEDIIKKIRKLQGSNQNSSNLVETSVSQSSTQLPPILSQQQSPVINSQKEQGQFKKIANNEVCNTNLLNKQSNISINNNNNNFYQQLNLIKNQQNQLPLFLQQQQLNFNNSNNNNLLNIQKNQQILNFDTNNINTNKGTNQLDLQLQNNQDQLKLQQLIQYQQLNQQNLLQSPQQQQVSQNQYSELINQLIQTRQQNQQLQQLLQNQQQQQYPTNMPGLNLQLPQLVQSNNNLMNFNLNQNLFKF